jgi:hypothetical protein
LRFFPVDRENVVRLENIERGERGAAGQRVAGVGMRVQEGAGHRVVEESVVDRVAGEDDGERQVAPGDAFRQAHEVGADGVAIIRGLFVGEEGAGAAAADGDFVADQVDFEAVAELAGEAQVFRVVHRHAGGALHQWFDDQGRDGFAMTFQVAFQCGGSATGDIGR